MHFPITVKILYNLLSPKAANKRSQNESIKSDIFGVGRQRTEERVGKAIRSALGPTPSKTKRISLNVNFESACYLAHFSRNLAHLVDFNGVSTSLVGFEPTPWDVDVWNIKDWRRE